MNAGERPTFVVSLHQQGEILLLGWTMSEQNQDGSAAEDLVGFRILRYVYPPGETCPDHQ